MARACVSKKSTSLVARRFALVSLVVCRLSFGPSSRVAHDKTKTSNLLGKLLARVHHLERDEREALLLKALDDLAGQAALHGICTKHAFRRQRRRRRRKSDSPGFSMMYVCSSLGFVAAGALISSIVFSVTQVPRTTSSTPTYYFRRLRRSFQSLTCWHEFDGARPGGCQRDATPRGATASRPSRKS